MFTYLSFSLQILFREKKLTALLNILLAARLAGLMYLRSLRSDVRTLTLTPMDGPRNCITFPLLLCVGAVGGSSLVRQAACTHVFLASDLGSHYGLMGSSCSG